MYTRCLLYSLINPISPVSAFLIRKVLYPLVQRRPGRPACWERCMIDLSFQPIPESSYLKLKRQKRNLTMRSESSRVTYTVWRTWITMQKNCGLTILMSSLSSAAHMRLSNLPRTRLRQCVPRAAGSSLVELCPSALMVAWYGHQVVVPRWHFL
jgi:hypothetical protein